ncbi:MAG: efflux transporter outer membrane subunit [Burkholderiaceae bacterium]
MTRFFRTSLVPLVAALVLAGCASTPDFTPRAAPAAPAAFKEDGGARFVAVAPAGAQARGAWWRAFSDPVLDDLVARAAAGNTSLQVAAARVDEARALLKASRADLFPQLGLNAGVSRATIQPGFGAAPGQAANLGQVGLGASWEPDLFGKLSQARDAASLDEQAREAQLLDARLVVQSEVAQAYFELRALDAERAILRRTVATYRDTLHLTERRYQAGDVAELDLARVQSQVASTDAEALALDRDRALHEHALAVLLGEVPTNFTLPEATDWDGALPAVPAGLPGAVLARRPDVAAAQRAMQAAEARAGVARKAWFPDVTLTANGGVASTDLGDLFKWSARAWGVGALLSLPVFDGGRRAAGVQQAEAQWDVAAASYRESVLGAFRDVEDQLASLRLLSQQAGAQQAAVDAATRATALSDARYRNGLVSQLELLDAQRTELANRRAAVQVRAAQYDATVGLIRALGGGWGDAPATAQAAPAAARSPA